MLIHLPWPPTELSPNASKQGNWRGKSNAANLYKWECVEKLKRARVSKWMGGPLHIATFYHPPPRTTKYDLDNALARIKHGLDRVAKSIKVDDGEWQSMSLHRGASIKGGAVVIRLIEHEKFETAFQTLL